MITAITHFPLRPGMTMDQHIKEIQKTIPLYQGEEQLVRKYLCLDLEAGTGRGVYLWKDKEAALAYFDRVSAAMQAQLGFAPKIEFFDTPVVVDNEKGEVQVVT
ncbi:MAG: monooxygenase [Gammaproteobacteria bacterium]|nr:monooxygenase [Gammaproteobacteria bacterium]